LKGFLIREYACSRFLGLGQEGSQILPIPDIGVTNKTSGNAFGGVVKKLANVPKQATVKVNLMLTPPHLNTFGLDSESERLYCDFCIV
jgi:hypothetical protein